MNLQLKNVKDNRTISEGRLMLLTKWRYMVCTYVVYCSHVKLILQSFNGRSIQCEFEVLTNFDNNILLFKIFRFKII